MALQIHSSNERRLGALPPGSSTRPRAAPRTALRLAIRRRVKGKGCRRWFALVLGPFSGVDDHAAKRALAEASVVRLLISARSICASAANKCSMKGSTSGPRSATNQARDEMNITGQPIQLGDGDRTTLPARFLKPRQQAAVAGRWHWTLRTIVRTPLPAMRTSGAVCRAGRRARASRQMSVQRQTSLRPTIPSGVRPSRFDDQSGNSGGPLGRI